MAAPAPELAHGRWRDPSEPAAARKRFDREATAGLAESIRVQGIIQPVVLRPRPAGGFELIAGERRWRAAREANLPTLPALIRDAADRDALLLGLVENVAREELSPIEEARAYAILADEFELSLGEIAERVGGSKPAFPTACACWSSRTTSWRSSSAAS